MRRILSHLQAQSRDSPLRRSSKPVNPSLILTPRLQRMCASIVTTMMEHRGWGLSAPQCGHFDRVISLLVPRLSSSLPPSLLPSSSSATPARLPSSSVPPSPLLDSEKAPMDWDDLLLYYHPLVLINPRLVSFSHTSSFRPESCLSLPDLVGLVRRSDSVEVEFLTVKGEEERVKLSGFEAACAQHEIDHLDGRLLIDHINEEEADRRMTTLSHYQQLLSNR